MSSGRCGARGALRFRFRCALPVGAISGQKGGFLAVFWGFSAPNGEQKSRTSREIAQKQDGGPSYLPLHVYLYDVPLFNV